MTAPEDREVSIYIAANSAADARALFEKAIAMVLDGTYYDERLISPATEGGGCASVTVHRPD